nr:M48 family metalloprotease [Rathayibacter oskolensis]
MIVGLVSLVLAPIVATIVQLSISRQREYLADATSALTTRHPDALASALLKLESAGRPMRRQNSSMAHLWIADPAKPGAIARLFATHPPIADRVARLTEMGSRF